MYLAQLNPLPVTYTVPPLTLWRFFIIHLFDNAFQYQGRWVGESGKDGVNACLSVNNNETNNEKFLRECRKGGFSVLYLVIL